MKQPELFKSFDKYVSQSEGYSIINQSDVFSFLEKKKDAHLSSTVTKSLRSIKISPKGSATVPILGNIHETFAKIIDNIVIVYRIKQQAIEIILIGPHQFPVEPLPQPNPHTQLKKNKDSKQDEAINTVEKLIDKFDIDGIFQTIDIPEKVKDVINKVDERFKITLKDHLIPFIIEHWPKVTNNKTIGFSLEVSGGKIVGGTGGLMLAIDSEGIALIPFAGGGAYAGSGVGMDVAFFFYPGPRKGLLGWGGTLGRESFLLTGNDVNLSFGGDGVGGSFTVPGLTTGTGGAIVYGFVVKAWKIEDLWANWGEVVKKFKL